MESGSGRARRREEAYRHPAGVHRSAQRVEAEASAFFAEVGDEEAASRHARNAVPKASSPARTTPRAAACAGAMA